VRAEYERAFSNIDRPTFDRRFITEWLSPSRRRKCTSRIDWRRRAARSRRRPYDFHAFRVRWTVRLALGEKRAAPGYIVRISTFDRSLRRYSIVRGGPAEFGQLRPSGGRLIYRINDEPVRSPVGRYVMNGGGTDDTRGTRYVRNFRETRFVVLNNRLAVNAKTDVGFVTRPRRFAP